MYRDNHYVPEWYQKRFFPPGGNEWKFYYLNMRPDKLTSSGGHVYTRTALNRWGPDRCFKQKDLYTTTFGAWFSTEIEEKFFGGIETTGKRAVEHYTSYEHPKWNPPSLEALLRYMSVQRLRTPGGLAYLTAMAKSPA